MKKNRENIIIIIFIIFVIFVGLVLIGEKATRPQEGQEINQEQETGNETSNFQEEEYPNNLLEGVVRSVDPEKETFVLEVKAFLIKTSQQDKMEKSIKVTESTICEIYYISTGETDSCEFSDIAVDDNVVAFTIESTYDEINNLEEFTAKKISKRVD